MKYLLLLTILLTFSSACNNIEDSREEILTLSSDFDTAIEKVRQVYQKLSGELEVWSMYQGRIQETQDSVTIDDPAPTGELADMHREFSEYSGRFSKLAQEIGESANTLNQQKPQLDALKNALEKKGKFEGNQSRVMSDLRQSLNETESKIEGWTQQVDKIGQDIKSKYTAIATKQGLPTE